MRHLAARADRGQDDRRKNQDEKREVVPGRRDPADTLPPGGGVVRQPL